MTTLHTLGDPHAFARALRPAEPRISIVVPAMNEARNLEVILPQLPEVHEVILVDGGSVDGTIETARRILPEIRVAQQTRKGKGNALAVGFAAVTGDIVVMFDADGSADPKEIDRFVQALLDGADFAKGSRYTAGGGSTDLTGIRSLGNKCLNGNANRLFKTKFTDLCYGYNAFWADIIPVIDLPDPALPAPANGMLWGDGFEVETLISCRVAASGLKVSEVPSFELDRIFGESNLNAISDGTRCLRTMYAERRRARRARKQGLALPAAQPRETEMDLEALFS
jgi:glycosyltransferase involved in cell wall biosynthesis